MAPRTTEEFHKAVTSYTNILLVRWIQLISARPWILFSFLTHSFRPPLARLISAYRDRVASMKSPLQVLFSPPSLSLSLCFTFLFLSVLRQLGQDTQPQTERCWVKSESGSTQWEWREARWKKSQKHCWWSEETKSKTCWWSTWRKQEQELLQMGGEANLAGVHCLHPHHQEVQWCKC